MTLKVIAQQPAPSATMNMTEEQVNDANIQLMRQDIRSERKKVVAAYLPLTETEATKFWPLYDRYIGETIKVNDVRFALIAEGLADIAIGRGIRLAQIIGDGDDDRKAAGIQIRMRTENRKLPGRELGDRAGGRRYAVAPVDRG